MQSERNGQFLRIRRFWKSALAAGALGCAVAVTAAPALTGTAALAESSSSERSLDTIILNSGRIITGRILEEADTTVRVEVVIAGIRAERTYERSDILEIKRATDAADEEPKLDRDVEAKTFPVRNTKQPSSAKPADEEIGDGTAQLYVVELKGRWAIDVSETPLRKLFDEVDEKFDDLVPGVGLEHGRLVVDPGARREHIVVLKLNMSSAPGFNTIFRAEELAPIVMDEIVKKGRRIVFWVEEARGGAAFLPWVSPEMYFTPDGELGGVANLDDFSSGDKMVDEKLIGAFFGAAEGFAIKGGYADHLDAMRAMLRKQNWLWVRFEGGRPIYSTAGIEENGNRADTEDGEPNGPDPKYSWTLLTDNGEGDNKDESEIEGNDIFGLTAEWGEKLGISDGTAETIDDLAFGLGVQRNYVVVDSEAGQKVFDRWTERLDDALVKANWDESNGLPLGTLWREYNDIEVQGDFNERKRARGRKISLLRKIRAYVNRFGEVADPEGTFRAQLDVMISQHKLEAEDDARAQRRGGR